MKKFVSLVTAAVLWVTVAFSGMSVVPSSTIPEILTVQADGNGEYGYVDYSFVDGDGNELDIFGEKSYKPQQSEISLFSFFTKNNSLSLPAAFDSRDNNCVTPVKQQGLSGNCWAFSTMSMLESDAILNDIDDLTTADYSEAHFSWFTSKSLTDNTDDPTYGDGFNFDSPFEVGGNWMIAAGSLARWTGAAEDADYPFSPMDLSSMGNYDESSRYDRGSGVIIKSAEELLDMNDAKQWIMDHGSATLAFYFGDEYYNSSSCAYFYNGTNTLNHEITVVGWDDNYSLFNFNADCRPEANGAWLCKNSWGVNWGDDGYFWISYYDTSIEQFAGFSVRPADDYYRNYTYNGAGWESYISHNGSAQLANVFTAKGPELLNSVSTYTMSPDQEITVKIYKNLPSGYTGPEKGTLALEYSTVLRRPGYHTIEFDNKIELEKGTVFSVVIEYVSDGIIYIPLESNGRGTNAYACNACESYANLPAYNAGWYDVLLYGVENVFIQAFTECNHNTQPLIHEPTCTENGYEINICSLCGKTVSENIIYSSGHNFSEWSDYVHDFETDKEISSRECLNCGHTEERTVYYVRNTITINDLIDMLYEMITGFLRNIFLN
ncbi:MAG: hypothetical protein IJE48_08810 [Clostridia bacterium]|nr:hypothetical protein [Clostridia bacterium]